MYLFLLSQPDLAYCGVLPMWAPRWARKAKGLSVADVEADLAQLAEGPRPFIVMDEDTGELLVRSLIRLDGVWKQPNIMKSARESAALVESSKIRAALLAELLRIPAQESSSHAVRQAHEEFVADLHNPSGNPSPNPSGKGIEEGEPDPGYPQERAVNGTRDSAGHDPATADLAISSSQVNGIINPSRNPSGNPSPDPSQGKGDGYGPVLLVPPNPGNPSPTPRAAARGGMTPLWPAPVADAKSGEGDDPGRERTPCAVDALVAEVRARRRDWAGKSVRRVLDDPSVLDRPWPLVRAAMLAVAADPASQHPGRLAHDGPWWAALAPTAGSGPRLTWLPWCGKCNEQTRMRDTDDNHAERCPDCGRRVAS